MCDRRLVNAPILSIIALMLFSPCTSTAADDAAVTELKRGEETLVYWQINLTGLLWLSIRGPTGLDCVHLHWRTYPLFLKKSIGKTCGNVRLEVPGLSSGAVAASLYARSDVDDVTIIGSSSETVAHNYTLPQ